MSLFVDRKIAAARKAVCATCPSFDAKLKRCKTCKCFLPLKTQMKVSTCPEGKWKR